MLPLMVLVNKTPHNIFNLMDKKGIKEYIKKYLDGTISKKEEDRLERFEKDLIQKNANRVFRHERHKEMLKNRMKSVIDNPYKRKKRTYLNIAASIAILIGVSFFGYYATLKPPVEVVNAITTTTELGQRMSLALSDGTKVRLNSGSTLRFPEKFSADIREVELVGEAFFQVAKDSDRPFVITSDGLKTKVLGTSFNVKAYPENKEVTVTVATGKVMVSSKNDELILTPNEQGVYSKEHTGISKQEVEIASFIEWKDGTLRLENISLLEAAKVMEKWYGVKIRFENPRISKYRFTGTFYNNEKLQVVLNSIEYALKGISLEQVQPKEILIRER